MQADSAGPAEGRGQDKTGPSLVLVSHSATLVGGVRELVDQIARGKVPIFTAGGYDDGTLGTSPGQILAALEAADNPAGTLVLMDLGSSILGTEMILDELPLEQRARVLLCEAPFVEGAVAAAAQLAAGASLAEAAAEARGALLGKAAQLGVELTAAAPGTTAAAAEREETVTVPNPMGLHARPAALFVRTAGKFSATITLSNLTRGNGPVSAKSANGVALLDARRGDEIVIGASGADAEQALATLRELVASGFGETELPAVPSAPRATATAPGVLGGIPAAPGVALGPARIVRPAPPAVETRRVQDPGAEWARLAEAIARARTETASLRLETAVRLGEYHAAIFDAHLLFMDDPALIEPVRQRVLTEQVNAEAAWQGQVQAMAARYEQTGNPILQARAADIRDVGARVLRLLLGESVAGILELDRPAILIAPDLTPSQTATLDPGKALAICTAGGGPTSHTAILARRLGVPAVVALGKNVLDIADGTSLAVDGDQGLVIVAPEPAVQAQYEARQEAARQSRVEFASARLQPAVTRDGRRVEVAANIGSLADARVAVMQGAEGVGLLRTEFLYLDRQVAPDEEEQVAAYRAIFAALAGRRIVVRTFDIGGDKPVPYLNLPPEANPFLGWRGLRLGLALPEILKAQLRAALRAGVGQRLAIMFPMVATVDEVERARALFAQADAELRAAGVPTADQVELGIMVEIPAAGLMADRLAGIVDFFSLGTNDLTQYTLAADRTNPKTAALADGLEPAVLRLIRRVTEAAHAEGKWVGLCGELGGDPTAVPVLLGLDLDELSMNAPAIPETKAIIRRLDTGEARMLAEAALGEDSAQAVRSLVLNRLPWLGQR